MPALAGHSCYLPLYPRSCILRNRACKGARRDSWEHQNKGIECLAPLCQEPPFPGIWMKPEAVAHALKSVNSTWLEGAALLSFQLRINLYIISNLTISSMKQNVQSHCRSLTRAVVTLTAVLANVFLILHRHVCLCIYSNSWANCMCCCSSPTGTLCISCAFSLMRHTRITPVPRQPASCPHTMVSSQFFKTWRDTAHSDTLVPVSCCVRPHKVIRPTLHTGRCIRSLAEVSNIPCLKATPVIITPNQVAEKPSPQQP